MKKDDIRTIFIVMATVIIYFVLVSLNSQLFSGIFFAVIVGFWIYSIYDKIKYRNNLYVNQIRFPTQNDSHSKIASLFFSVLIITGVTLTIYITKEYSITYFIGLAIGLILLTNGILDLPKGCLRIKEDSIYFAGANDSIEVSKIELVEIYNEKIEITDNSNIKKRITLLELNEEWANKIKLMLNNKLDDEIVKIKLR
jgi:hypothetical protein